MGIREALEKHNKGLVVPVSVAVCVLVVAFSLWTGRRSQPELPGTISKAYYSDDDGRSYFADDVGKRFPFERGGKQAYRAYVYRCAGSDKPFVGLLGRQAKPAEPDVRPADSTTRSSEAVAPPGDAGLKNDERSSPIEVKRPGDHEWVPLTSPDGQQLVASLCPGGRPEPVLVGVD